MFTGIIEEIGHILDMQDSGSGITCTIQAHKILKDLEVDHSVCVSGVCLTVTGVQDGSFMVTMVPETLSKTAPRAPAEPVNLERAVRLSDRLGGHLVQGHVDTAGKVISIEEQGDSRLVSVQFPLDFRKYLVNVGSVTVDGVSLTVARLSSETFTVALIPHTLAMTTLGNRGVGDLVNLEFDVLAKYVETLLKPVAP